MAAGLKCVSIYAVDGGETNLPENKLRSSRVSRMKKRNGRSALNSTGCGSGSTDAQQRSKITAVAAAASDPIQNYTKWLK